jgi:transposase InsO family protein
MDKAPPEILRRLRQVTWTERRIDEYLRYLKTGGLPNIFATKKAKKSFVELASYLHVDGDRLFVRDEAGVRLDIIPTSQVQTAFENATKDPNLALAGLGISPVFERISQVSIGISRSDVARMLNKGGSVASQQKQVVAIAPLRLGIGQSNQQTTRLLTAPFQKWNMDLADLTSWRNKNFNWLFVCVDAFSKQVWLRPLTTKSGTAVTNALRSLFLEVGPPSALASDNGGEFRNQEVEAVCREFGVTQIFSSAYRPSSNLAEAYVKNAKRLLSTILYDPEKKKQLLFLWPGKLPVVQFSLNTKRNTTTNAVPLEIARGSKLPVHGQPLEQEELANAVEPSLQEREQGEKEREATLKRLREQVKANIDRISAQALKAAKRPSIRVGSFVRISEATKASYRKGKNIKGVKNRISWSPEIYKVVGVREGNSQKASQYVLQREYPTQGEKPLERHYYATELLPTSLPTAKREEEVVLSPVNSPVVSDIGTSHGSSGQKSSEKLEEVEKDQPPPPPNSNSQQASQQNNEAKNLFKEVFGVSSKKQVAALQEKMGRGKREKKERKIFIPG